MLALEREDLVVKFAGLARIVEALFVRAAGIVLQFLDGSLHAVDAFLGKDDLVTHASDAHSQVFVVSLDVVQTDFLVFKFVFEGLEVSLLLILCLVLVSTRVEPVPVVG